MKLTISCGYNGIKEPQISINTDDGTGYRLAGGKYDGIGREILRKDLTDRDISELRAMLDKAAPVSIDDVARLKMELARYKVFYEALARHECHMQDIPPDDEVAEGGHMAWQVVGYDSVLNYLGTEEALNLSIAVMKGRDP